MLPLDPSGVIAPRRGIANKPAVGEITEAKKARDTESTDAAFGFGESGTVEPRSDNCGTLPPWVRSEAVRVTPKYAVLTNVGLGTQV